jgi:hypothetical protein
MIVDHGGLVFAQATRVDLARWVLAELGVTDAALDPLRSVMPTLAQYVPRA